ncbi:hypothetical protein R3P38DRAFT_2518066 [Favolaschia claudopus]|uniref:Transmembrane protein n=1 Tax=Favolaschia claudopus TaxID=2862362 RepID=A0AAW0CBL5_9AGAR
MISPSSILHSIRSFRLGYNPAYPGRWTTPAIILVFSLLTAFIACINRKPPFPLSAYEFVQEITYTPNDTLPALPLSGWIPSVLQAPTSSFQPQTLSVGDSFTLNNSLLSFTITSALDRKNKNAPVSVFPYFNNPFSTACDIVCVYSGSQAERNSLYHQFSAEIVCNFPATAVTLSWQESIDAGDNFIFRNLVVDLYPNMVRSPIDVCAVFSDIFYRAETYSSAAALELGGNITGLILRYNITPSCSNPHKGDPGCLEIWPVDFSSTYTEFTVYDDRGVGQLLDPNFGGGLGSPDAATTNSSFPLPVPILPHMNPPAAQISRSLSNMFQSTFHYLRLELGNIHPNLIYASPDVYNQTISLPVAAGRFAGDVNSYRAQMANETFFFQVLKVVELFNTTARVPVMEYSRTIPRLKPLGSAMTSVFVSTFAMLSTIWTVFSLVAGALATMYSGETLVFRSIP